MLPIQLLYMLLPLLRVLLPHGLALLPFRYKYVLHRFDRCMFLHLLLYMLVVSLLHLCSCDLLHLRMYLRSCRYKHYMYELCNPLLHKLVLLQHYHTCDLVHQLPRLCVLVLHHIQYSKLRYHRNPCLHSLDLLRFLLLLDLLCVPLLGLFLLCERFLHHIQYNILRFRRIHHLHNQLRVCFLLLLCLLCDLVLALLVVQLVLRHIPSNAYLVSNLFLCRLDPQHCLLLPCDLVHQLQFVVL